MKNINSLINLHNRKLLYPKKEAQRYATVEIKCSAHSMEIVEPKQLSTKPHWQQ